jgi:hypothetical protein
MKWRTQIVLVGVVLLSAVALSSVKRGARCDTGRQGVGTCCPLMSGVGLLATNPWVAVGSTNGKAGVTAGGVTTNKQR